MKYSKLKFIIITVLCLLTTLWSECQCMEPLQEEKNARNVMRLIDKDDVQNYPHSAVLSLVSYFNIRNSIKTRSATCFLIGDAFALTAAHAVFHMGIEAHRIECYIGRHGDNLLGSVIPKTVKVKSYVYASKYEWDNHSHERNLNYDYAILYLGEAEEIKDIKDIKDIKPINPVYYYTKPINELVICGYPGAGYNIINKDRDHESASFPYEVSANYVNQSLWAIHLNTPCFGGMSGAPIRFTDDGKVWNAISILVCDELSSQRHLWMSPYEKEDRYD